MCQTCVDIQGDDLGPFGHREDRRCCEHVGTDPSVRPLRQVQKMPKTQRAHPLQQYVPQDFRSPYLLARRPKYAGDHARSYAPSPAAKPSSTNQKDTMMDVCQAGGSIPAALAEGRTVGIQGSFKGLSNRARSAACTTARALVGGALAMVMPDDPIALLAASLQRRAARACTSSRQRTSRRRWCVSRQLAR